MKKIGVLILLCLSSLSSLAQPNRIGTFRFHAKGGGHAAIVTFSVRGFNSAKPAYDPNIGVTVNGRKAHGAESTPEAEFASIVVSFDGRNVTFPRRFYADCFDPNLRDNPVVIRFLKSFTAVRITIGGSDGAGGYQVRWTVRKHGRITRSFFEP